VYWDVSMQRLMHRALIDHASQHMSVLSVEFSVHAQMDVDSCDLAASPIHLPIQRGHDRRRQITSNQKAASKLANAASESDREVLHGVIAQGPGWIQFPNGILARLQDAHLPLQVAAHRQAIEVCGVLTHRGVPGNCPRWYAVDLTTFSNPAPTVR